MEKREVYFRGKGAVIESHRCHSRVRAGLAYSAFDFVNSHETRQRIKPESFAANLTRA